MQEQMPVEQISMFLENNSGRLSEVTAILTESNVNIRALADASDFGVLRLIVDDTDTAQATLKINGFSVGKTQVVAAEVPDRPGGLHEILTILHEAKINVEYMYAFVRTSGDNAVMIFRIEPEERAVALFASRGVPVIDEQRLHSSQWPLPGGFVLPGSDPHRTTGSTHAMDHRDRAFVQPGRRAATYTQEERT